MPAVAWVQPTDFSIPLNHIHLNWSTNEIYTQVKSCCLIYQRICLQLHRCNVVNISYIKLINFGLSGEKPYKISYFWVHLEKKHCIKYSHLGPSGEKNIL